MPNPIPPLNALRAFEAVARHLNFSAAADELNVTPSALSHQIKGLEDFLGLQLFDRRARSIELTEHGRLLHPGVMGGFGLIRDAVASVRAAGSKSVLVVSTPPGLTSKWLAKRLYRFAEAHPDVDLRISSTVGYANFRTDGIDVAIRNTAVPFPVDPTLSHEKLLDAALVPVCSPKLVAKFGSLDAPGVLARVPLIHDDQLAGRPEVPGWKQWLARARMEGGDLKRGLRFSSADHALEAALEGTGLLLTHAILAYDDVKSGRLILPFRMTQPSGRAYYFVCPRSKEKQNKIEALRTWLGEEIGQLDRRLFRAQAGPRRKR